MRIIAMGGEALAEGFALLGVETYANPSAAEVEGVLAELRRSREKAMVYLQQDLAQLNVPSLERIRREGGRVVVTEVPRLHDPGSYRRPVEDLVARVLGPGALEERP
jgi:vacuolar-type H+-ATPase subunit F/Vma7